MSRVAPVAVYQVKFKSIIAVRSELKAKTKRVAVMTPTEVKISL